MIRIALVSFSLCAALAFAKPPPNSNMPPGALPQDMMPKGDPACMNACTQQMMGCMNSCMPAKQPGKDDKPGQKASFSCVSKCSKGTKPCLDACEKKAK
jgi:hypothetical protein